MVGPLLRSSVKMSRRSIVTSRSTPCFRADGMPSPSGRNGECPQVPIDLQWEAGKPERVLIQRGGNVRGPTIKRLQYGLLGLVSSMSAGTPQTTRSRCFATRLWFDMRANA